MEPKLGGVRWFTLIFTFAMRVVGLGVVIHEVWMAKTTEPTVLVLAAAMLGLPAFLRGNGK